MSDPTEAAQGNDQLPRDRQLVADAAQSIWVAMREQLRLIDEVRYTADHVILNAVHNLDQNGLEELIKKLSSARKAIDKNFAALIPTLEGLQTHINCMDDW